MSSCADQRAPLAVRGGRLVAAGRVGGTQGPRSTALHERPVTTPLARSIALAHLIEDHIEAGRLHSAGAAADWLGMTTARVSQLLNLCQLAPGVQLAALSGTPVSARTARALAVLASWAAQRRKLPHLNPDTTPGGGQ